MPSQSTMCDDSCSRVGTRRCYRHSSSADRWEARSRFRPSARGGRTSRRHVARSRLSAISGDSAGADANRGVHQVLCGGIVVSRRPPIRGPVACGVCPGFCYVVCASPLFLVVLFLMLKKVLLLYCCREDTE